MLRRGSRRRGKSSLHFSSAKTLKRNRMVRTRRISSQDYVKEGIARVLDFDGEAVELHLLTIQETAYNQETGHCSQQPQISGDVGTEYEEEGEDLEVISLSKFSYFSLCKVGAVSF